ncbi:ClpX C4-type zinc finger protein [Nocardioides sp. MH1]|uniref:ClpX C4-type zinc finger protein n=1 Tax=Nocardioides sp. MH1 TaxID=3242490 RepID=UPI003522B4D2
MVERVLEEKLCSFCGEPGSPERRLAGGLGAMICFECLESYYEHSRSQKRVTDATRPVWNDMSDAQLLATLPLILKSAQQNADFARDWVEFIRARKISWAEIGKALGVSRQAAWERFANRQADTGSPKKVRA